MSVDAVVARIAQLNSVLAPQPVAAPVTATSTAQTAAPANATFASLMGQATTGATGATALPSTGGTPAGQAMVNLARQEVGVAEQPPGSNDSPRIAQYRQATAGSGVGPWCAYFVSWAARSVGAPLGEQGQGFGSVEQVWDWAQRSGKAIPAGTQPPQTGDLIVWAAATSAWSNPSIPTARSTRSRATPPTVSRSGLTGTTAAAPSATSGSAERGCRAAPVRAPGAPLRRGAGLRR